MGGGQASNVENRVERTSDAPRRRLLGEYLRNDGAITEEQCESALARQSQGDESGEHRLIGEILIEMDVIGATELQRALDRQWEDDLASMRRKTGR